jgi:uncharacterized protein (TIGR02118 family)
MPGLACDLFLPHPDHAQAPIFKDGPPPAAILEFRAQSADLLEAIAADSGLGRLLGKPANWRAGHFLVRRQPVAGEAEASARTAPLSFVVRYFGPTADPAHFARHYVENHPPILARFPKIRNVLCYVPTGRFPDGFAEEPCIIRNEVVFESLADLAAALNSPILVDLRADSKTFAAFGFSTHHAMMRSTLA